MNIDISTITRLLEEEKTKSHSKTAEIRKLFDLIQGAIDAGVPLAKIVSILGTGGLEISLTTLKSALQRIRKERVSGNGNTMPMQPTMPMPTQYFQPTPPMQQPQYFQPTPPMQATPYIQPTMPMQSAYPHTPPLQGSNHMMASNAGYLNNLINNNI